MGFGGFRKRDAKDPEYLTRAWEFLNIVNENSGTETYLYPAQVLIAMTHGSTHIFEVVFSESNVAKSETAPTENSINFTKKEEGKDIIYFLALYPPSFKKWKFDDPDVEAYCFRLMEVIKDDFYPEWPNPDTYSPIYANYDYSRFWEGPPARKGPPFEKTNPTNPDCLKIACQHSKAINEISDCSNYIFPIEVLFAEKSSEDYNMEVLYVESTLFKQDIPLTDFKVENCQIKKNGTRFIYRLHTRIPPTLKPYEPEYFDTRNKYWKLRTCNTKDHFDINNYLPYGIPKELTFNFA